MGGALQRTAPADPSGIGENVRFPNLVFRRLGESGGEAPCQTIAHATGATKAPTRDPAVTTTASTLSLSGQRSRATTPAVKTKKRIIPTG